MEAAPATTGPLLEASRLEVSRAGSSHLIRVTGVDWQVEAGESWVIGGAPDSGKTDLLQTAAGLQPPAGGSVRLFGREMANLPEPELLQQRTRVGFVFKGGGRIFADLTVAENIALPLRYHCNLKSEEALDTVHALLALTDLGPIGNESPQRLVASQRQKVGLARALALKPEILFLDEPLAGLAWRLRQWWLDFLLQLAQGVPFMDAKKIAVVATANDFAPWSGRPVRFAVIRDRHWQALGEQNELPNI